jgi:hypothetical protein
MDLSRGVVAPVLFRVISCLRSQPTNCIAPALFAYGIPVYAHFVFSRPATCVCGGWPYFSLSAAGNFAEMAKYFSGKLQQGMQPRQNMFCSFYFLVFISHLRPGGGGVFRPFALFLVFPLFFGAAGQFFSMTYCIDISGCAAAACRARCCVCICCSLIYH